MDTDSLFFEAARNLVRPRVLEMGTKRSNPDVSTCVANDWIPEMSLYVRTDAEEGLDVDIVCDAHNLYGSLALKMPNFISSRYSRFDVIISRSVFEHLEKPWIVAKEMYHCLNSGGLVFVQTHHTFPIHGYPDDYWRFTTKGLEVLFSEDAGFKVIKSDYYFPAQIHADRIPGIEKCEAYLNVNIFAQKI